MSKKKYYYKRLDAENNVVLIEKRSKRLSSMNENTIEISQEEYNSIWQMFLEKRAAEMEGEQTQV